MLKIKIFVLCTIFISINVQAKNNKKSLNVIFIGNSITHGACLRNPNEQAPPVITSNYLSKQGYRVRFVNCGYNGSTSVDFLPATKNLFRHITHAADSLSDDGQLIFSIMLGTNDSAIKGPTGAPVTRENYYKNLSSIIDSLKSKYPKSLVVLNQPTWYSPNTYNRSLYLSEGLSRLNTYFPVIKEIVRANSSFVALGDTIGYKTFEHNYLKYLTPEQGNAGTFYLHPNVKGAKKLGFFWGKAISSALKKMKYNDETKY